MILPCGDMLRIWGTDTTLTHHRTNITKKKEEGRKEKERKRKYVLYQPVQPA